MRTALLFRRLVLLGTPLTLGILELWHPLVAGSRTFATLSPQVDWWLILHLLQLPLFGLMALAILLLTAGGSHCHVLRSLSVPWGVCGLVPGSARDDPLSLVLESRRAHEGARRGSESESTLPIGNSAGFVRR